MRGVNGGRKSLSIKEVEGLRWLGVEGWLGEEEDAEKKREKRSRKIRSFEIGEPNVVQTIDLDISLVVDWLRRLALAMKRAEWRARKSEESLGQLNFPRVDLSLKRNAPRHGHLE